MKVSQFNKNGVITLGLETPQGLVDVPAEAARRGAQAPKTVLELIQGGEATRRQVEALAEGAACFAQGPAAPAVTGGSRILCRFFFFRFDRRRVFLLLNGLFRFDRLRL